MQGILGGDWCGDLLCMAMLQLLELGGYILAHLLDDQELLSSASRRYAWRLMVIMRSVQVIYQSWGVVAVNIRYSRESTHQLRYGTNSNASLTSAGPPRPPDKGVSFG